MLRRCIGSGYLNNYKILKRSSRCATVPRATEAGGQVTTSGSVALPAEFHDVFARTPTKDVLRALAVFKLCTNDVFVKNSSKVSSKDRTQVHKCRNMVLKTILRRVLKSFYCVSYVCLKKTKTLYKRYC